MGGKGSNEIKETAAEKELARISMEQWGRYASEMRPFENKWLADIQKDTGAQKAQAAGEVNALLGGEFDAQRHALSRENLAGGVNANSARFKAGFADPAQAKATGLATASVKQAVDDRQLGRKMAAVSVGRGEAAQAQTGLSDLASQAARTEIDKEQNRFLTRASIGAGIGTAAGMATRSVYGKDQDKPIG